MPTFRRPSRRLPRRVYRQLGSACLAGVLALAGGGAAAEVETRQFKVVGSWSNLSNFKVSEKPFWSEGLAEASEGRLSGDIKSISELGLKGFEVLRLTKLGVFDFAHGVIGYIAGENARSEGVDLSIMAQDIETAREITRVYRPVMEKVFEETYGAKLLVLNSYPSQMLWCNAEVNSIADLEGKKIRVYSTTLGDFVEGVGGVSVTVPFAEVVPALQKGVVDCGITGTMPAYQAKWHEVATHAYAMRVGWGIAFGAVSLKTWNSLNADTQALLTEQFAQLEDAMWTNIAMEDEQGVICNTNSGECTYGEPGNMKLVTPSEADLAVREQILEDVIVKRWAERCGADCVKDWNATVGKYIGIEADIPG